jgi:hypothetical protein
MLVFRRKRAHPGPTQVPCPVPLAALRTPPDHTWCIGTTYAGRRRRTDGGRDASPSQSPASTTRRTGAAECRLPWQVRENAFCASWRRVGEPAPGRPCPGLQTADSTASAPRCGTGCQIGSGLASPSAGRPQRHRRSRVRCARPPGRRRRRFCRAVRLVCLGGHTKYYVRNNWRARADWGQRGRAGVRHAAPCAAVW